MFFICSNTMPYKIVQTVEKEKCTLFFVPNNWERNNLLHWPKWKMETLLASEESYPNASWHRYYEMPSKKDGVIVNAEAELANMCQKRDTNSKEFGSQMSLKSQVRIAQENKRNLNSIQELRKKIVVLQATARGSKIFQTNIKGDH